MNWALQDAQNSFSKVVQLAKKEGPQIVTSRGERAAVVMSAEDYDALHANVRVRLGTTSWSRRSTPARAPGRDIDL